LQLTWPLMLAWQKWWREPKFRPPCNNDNGKGHNLSFVFPKIVIKFDGQRAPVKTQGEIRSVNEWEIGLRVVRCLVRPGY
jgi:hypothetical protein